MPVPNVEPSNNLRKPNNLRKLSKSPRVGRFAIANEFNVTVDALSRSSNFPRLKAFLPQNLWPWVWRFLKHYFSPRVDFPTYAGRNNNGVYRILPSGNGGRIRIAIAGDWGTGTDEAYRIARLMKSGDPDFTIHLGDVYYVGDESEIEENCLGKSMNGLDGVLWPKGGKGSFALNGNHEMYAKGGPYFNVFLKTLGMNGDAEGQVASYFCFESEKWLLLGIDTAYNSTGVPLLSSIPLINSIPFIGGDCHLEPALVEWLRDIVKLKDNPKPTVVLSHHQYFSAFDDGNYEKPARQLAEFLQGREFVWIWAHEHRLAIYERCTTKENLILHGRCLGHGGMPVEIAMPDISSAPLMFYDTRSHKLDDGSDVGQNGYVILTIQADVLTLEYFDIDDTLLFSETFAQDSKGQLQYNFQDPGILSRPQKVKRT